MTLVGVGPVDLATGAEGCAVGCIFDGGWSTADPPIGGCKHGKHNGEMAKGLAHVAQGWRRARAQRTRETARAPACVR
eukprot:2828135-Prymnesium_polylepis.1